MSVKLILVIFLITAVAASSLAVSICNIVNKVNISGRSNINELHYSPIPSHQVEHDELRVELVARSSTTSTTSSTTITLNKKQKTLSFFSTFSRVTFKGVALVAHAIIFTSFIRHLTHK